MFRHFPASGLFLVAILVLALSDRVSPESFGPGAPLVAGVQELGGEVAVWADDATRSVLGQLPSTGIPLGWIVGGGIALALDLIRRRAGRERSRQRRRA